MQIEICKFVEICVLKDFFFGEQDGVVSFMETEFKFVGFKIH